LQIPYELTAVEATVGLPLGGRARSPRRAETTRLDPLEALARAVERTIADGPPAVAFSGGRDSSLLLAVAAQVCRRAGIEPPLPITLCMPSEFSESDEHEWQERVLDHLRIDHWHRVPITGELDLVGPYARRHLLRGSLLFPANAHAVIPILEAAGSRCLISGLGGDELFSPQQWWSVHDLLGGRRALQQRDLVRLSAAMIPRRLRGLARRSTAADLNELHWLRPTARSRLGRSLRLGFEEPVLWGPAVRHVAARRDVVLPLRSMERLASASDRRVCAPFLDPGFIASLTGAGGWSGWGTRTAAMGMLARDLLPAEVVARKSKASFNRVFFGEESRAFATGWSGRGLDETLVDPEALRREWLSEVPDFRTSLLLQSAWLADRELRVETTHRKLDLALAPCP
jgi:Asparagine synthase